MKKEHFCEIINYIQELGIRQEKLTKALQSYTGDKDFTGFYSHDADFLVRWLEKTLGDTEEWISWWCWEAHFGDERLSIKIKGKNVDIRTPEQLYNFLEKCYEL